MQRMKTSTRLFRPYRIPTFQSVRYQSGTEADNQNANATNSPPKTYTSHESLVNKGIIKDGPHTLLTGFSWWGYEGAAFFFKTRTNPTVRLSFRNIITNESVRVKYSSDIPMSNYGLELGVRLAPTVSFGRPKVEFSSIPEALTTKTSWSLTCFTFFCHVFTIEQMPGTYFIRYGNILGFGLKYGALVPGQTGKLYLDHNPNGAFEVVRQSTFFNNLTALLGFPLSVLFFLSCFFVDLSKIGRFFNFMTDPEKIKALEKVKF